MRQGVLFVGVCAAAALAVQNAGAAISGISMGGFSGSESLITFDGLSGSVSSIGGVTFSHGGNAGHVGFYSGTRPMGPQGIEAMDNDQPFDGAPFVITFPSETARFGLEASFNSDNSDLVVEFFLGATSLGTGLLNGGPFASSPNPWVFGAFESTTAFDRVVVSAPSNGYVRIDNLRFEIPAPGAAGLMGLGGLVAMRRRR